MSDGPNLPALKRVDLHSRFEHDLKALSVEQQALVFSLIGRYKRHTLFQREFEKIGDGFAELKGTADRTEIRVYCALDRKGYDLVVLYVVKKKQQKIAKAVRDIVQQRLNSYLDAEEGE